MQPSFCLLALAALGTGLATPLARRQSSTWPEPEPCAGNCTYVHDPSVLKDSSGTWWRFSTNGDIAIASAPAITGPWTYLGAMLPGGSSINAVPNQEIWAPDVSFIDGTYYAYYAVSTIGSQASDIGVATATTPAPGSWTDHGSIGIPKSSSYNLIDPNYFRQTPTSPPYFTFGSAWNDVFQTQLSTGYTAWSSSVSPYNVAQNTTANPAVVEGSFQFWWTVAGTDYFYLFFSSGACCNTPPDLAPAGSEYKVLVCRATDPAGPFADQAGNPCSGGNGGTLVLGTHGASVYAPGGQGVYADSSLPFPVVYYHYVNPSVGYAYEDFQFGFNYLDFSSGWPVLTTAA